MMVKSARDGGGRLTTVGLWASWLTGVVSLAATGGCAGVRPPPPPAPVAISCRIVRSECTHESSGGQCATNAFMTDQMTTATTCYNANTDGTMDDKCKADFCGAAQARDGFNNGDCQAKSLGQASLFPAPNVPQGTGLCAPESGATRLALVSYTTRYRQCTADETGTCQMLTLQPPLNAPPVQNCFDARQALLQPPAVIDPYPPSGLGPPYDQYGTVNIISITLDSPSCAPIETEADALVYAVAPGLAATATGAGVTAPVTATGGEVIVKQDCSDDVFGCVPVALNQLRMNVANMTVAGASLSDVVISNTTPAPVTMTFNPGGPPTFSVAGGALNLLVSGMVGGVRSSFVTGTTAPLALTATSKGFTLAGTFTINNSGPNGQPLGITVATNVSGTPANAQQLACAGETGIQRLFGFEDDLSWSSAQATLSPVIAPVTQGCGALGIAGQGYMTIASAPFATSALTLGPALSVDLFIPGNQPNQFYLGALQMYLTCPSANVFNAYIGQDELTGKPQNAYSTFRYPLPSNVTGTLQQPLGDCSVGFALNVNQTGRTWILDNLRFTP